MGPCAIASFIVLGILALPFLLGIAVFAMCYIGSNASRPLTQPSLQPGNQFILLLAGAIIVVLMVLFSARGNRR